MKKIALATVAVLAITGSAFAGSDHYGSNAANQPTAAIDSSYTASVHTPAHAEKAARWPGRRPQSFRQQLTAGPKQQSGGPPLGI